MALAWSLQSLEVLAFTGMKQLRHASNRVLALS
jgi:hypothetical protein